MNLGDAASLSHWLKDSASKQRSLSFGNAPTLRKTQPAKNIGFLLTTSGLKSTVKIVILRGKASILCFSLRFLLAMRFLQGHGGFDKSAIADTLIMLVAMIQNTYKGQGSRSWISEFLRGPFLGISTILWGAGKLLSGPSLAFSEVIVWAK